MFNGIKSTLAAMVIGVATLTATTTKAQYAPGDMSGIVAMNQNFDNQFYAALPGLCWQTAIATCGQQLPFNAMTISASNNALTQQYSANNAAWARNSNTQMNAVGNWTTGAIRGNATYTNPSGGSYVLPYNQNSYYLNNGYMYGGYQPGMMNFYPGR